VAHLSFKLFIVCFLTIYVFAAAKLWTTVNGINGTYLSFSIHKFSLNNKITQGKEGKFQTIL